MASLYERCKAQFRRVLQLDDTPESIARGVSLGLLIAMTPTVGIQMIIVAIVHTLARANRLAGIAMVYISNPLTMVPIYWLDYAIGWLVLRPFVDVSWMGYDKFSELLDFNDPSIKGVFGVLREFAKRLVELGVSVAGPLFLGGLVLGLVCAIPAYPLTLRMVQRERAWMEKRREKRAARKQAGLPESAASDDALPADQ